MIRDDELEPKLGKIRSRGSKRDRRYLHQVLRAANLARGGADGASRRKSRFHGNRIGRGAGVGRVLASRDRHAAFRQRRVIIKSRIVKLAGKGLQAARAHLRYVQRDGVTRTGEPGQLYSAGEDRIDGKAFIDRAAGDRHQFRFIVSAEGADQYDDLRPVVRRLMVRMEEDLGTKLDWVAVDHYNTGHPHSHIILRGKDERGKDLIIAREYIAVGMRERAAEIVSLDLGPRLDWEIEARLHDETGQERLTSLDRRLLREAGEGGLVRSSDRDPLQQTLRAGRLRKLARLGLAEEVRPGQWRLADALEQTLRRMGERGDIIKTMHRAMTARGVARAASDYAIYDPSAAAARPVTGRVVARGLSDEIDDRHYLIVDGVDGRSHYVEIGKAAATGPIPDQAIVRIEPRPVVARAVDRTVAAVAAANGGRYSLDSHLRHDPGATAAFAETHVRRLEAIRRATGGVEREVDGTWIIAPDHLECAAAYERQQAQASPVMVQTLSGVPLERLAEADGATWLDRELVADRAEPLRDAGFGHEVREAQARRRQWLIQQGLARQEQDHIVYRANMLAVLRHRELARVAGQLLGGTGPALCRAAPGRAGRGRLSPACRSGERPLRPDREEPRVHAGPLAAGAGTPSRQAGRRYRAGREHLLEHRTAAQRADGFVGKGVSGLIRVLSEVSSLQRS